MGTQRRCEFTDALVNDVALCLAELRRRRVDVECITRILSWCMDWRGCPWATPPEYTKAWVSIATRSGDDFIVRVGDMHSSSVHEALLKFLRVFFNAVFSDAEDGLREQLLGWDGVSKAEVSTLEGRECRCLFDLAKWASPFISEKHRTYLQLEAGIVSLVDEADREAFGDWPAKTPKEWKALFGWSPSTWRMRRKQCPEAFKPIPGERVMKIDPNYVGEWKKAADAKE